MENNNGTVTISKEEYLQYYEMEKALAGTDLTKLVFYRQEFNYHERYSSISVLNPTEALRALENDCSELRIKVNMYEKSLGSSNQELGITSQELDKTLKTLKSIQSTWWYKLFYK